MYIDYTTTQCAIFQ